MSEYTPTTEQIRDNYVEGMNAFYGERGASEYREQFDQWLAEARASVVTEEPEWEYRAVARELDGDVYDSTGPAPSEGEAIDLAAAHRLLDSNPDMPALVIGTQRRRKAGPWVPVEQGDET